MFRLILFLGWVLISLAGCQTPQAPKQLIPAFYHWKAVYDPGPAELKVVQQLKVQRLYVRLFDVDWDAQQHRPIPKSIVRFAKRPTGFSVIPVVFITNRTLLALPEAEVATLARNIARKIQETAKRQHLFFPEVQLDCDWSLSSRGRYFSLLSIIKKQMKRPISTTIRLHQIKYADRTGIPPVDRGMLMFYNMADWKEPTTQNSILDLDVAHRYTGFIEKYPLPLDVVLPLFRWTLVYRNNRFLTILNNVDRHQLTRLPFLKQQTDSNRFVSLRDTTAFGLSVREGDLFRAESSDGQALLRAKSELLQQIPNQSLTFALYHLDNAVLAPYHHDYLQTLIAPIPSF